MKQLHPQKSACQLHRRLCFPFKPHEWSAAQWQLPKKNVFRPQWQLPKKNVFRPQEKSEFGIA